MTSLGPLGGGCARKVGAADLRAALSSVADQLGRVPPGVVESRTDFFDACEVTTRAAVRKFVTSTDLLYAVSEDLYTCGYVGAVHAMSDVFALLGQPAWATVTLGLPPARVEQGGLSDLLAGAADAVVADGAVLAGGHSVYSAETFVSVAVSGIASESTNRLEPQPGDSLVLTKPLGSGIALSALKLGLVSESELASVFSLLKQSNRAASHVLKQINEENPGNVRAVTDVSGFGFLQAAALVGGEAMIQVEAPAVPLIPEAERLVAQGAVSPLTDKNLLAAESFTRFEGLSSREVATLNAFLNDPQTSGGLLAVLSPPAAHSLLQESAELPIRPAVVGNVDSPAKSGRGSVEVIIRPGGNSGSDNT